MEIVDYCIAIVSTIKTYCSDKELINKLCMHDKYHCHIFLSMSPELHSLCFIFYPQSTILSLYLVKSQLRCHHCYYTCLSCLGILLNFSKSLSHDIPHPLHNHSRSTSYVYKVFQYFSTCYCASGKKDTTPT